jgi:GTP-binding protein Era
MQHAVDQHLSDVDVVVWVIDGRAVPKQGERAVADAVFSSGLPVIIALNKIDHQKPTAIIERIGQIAEIVGEREYHALVPISALTGDGIKELVEQIVGLLPEGPPMFPPGMVTDMRPEELIAEYIREASLSLLRDELPHATGVEILEMEESDTGAMVIESVIWVERESQVGIVVGKAGSNLKEIGTNARKRIERLLSTPVHLDLRVKVRKHWRDDERHLERMGL